MTRQRASRWARARNWLGKHPLRGVLVALGLITALTGVVEIVAPRGLLTVLGASPTPLAAQLFGTVGLFMLVVGALLTQSLIGPHPNREVVFWACVQKLGAVVAVSIAVANELFGPIALLVAAFDLATAGLLALYWTRLRPAVPRRAHRTPTDDRA